MSTDKEKEHQIKIVELIQEAIATDVALREKYQVTDKFRFVRDRLHALLTQLETDLAVTQAQEKKAEHTTTQDETLVYVYLFNAKGTVIRDWKNMVLPKVFYEYSVNRPIYSEKTQIDAFIRSKANKNQHAYITVAVKKTDMLHRPEDSTLKDTMGNTLVKVRENSLRFENMIMFTHNWIDYRVNEDGEFIKK